MFFGRTDAKAETPVLWPPHAKSWLTGKDPDAGRDWGQEEKGMTGDEMAGWHHRLNGREFEWTPGVSDGQGGLACCSSWGRKESDTIEWLNWIELNINGQITQTKKNNKETLALNYTDTFNSHKQSISSKIEKYTFFSSIHGTFYRIDHIPAHKTWTYMILW